jgi:hypothetical protein
MTPEKSEELTAHTYRIVRYIPDLLRDEWVNIGVLLHDRSRGALHLRLMEDAAAFARLRRLHPEVDEAVLRGLAASLTALASRLEGGPAELLAKLDESLSNNLQLSPQRAVRAADAARELERLYETHVVPPERRRRSEQELEGSRASIRRHLRELLAHSGILGRMEVNWSVAEFTFPGDTTRLDFSFRRNGARGFLHALPLMRDAAQAKAFVFTAQRIRERIAAAEFTAVTEAPPPEDGARYTSCAAFLRAQAIEVVPATRLYEYVSRLRGSVQ